MTKAKRSKTKKEPIIEVVVMRDQPFLKFHQLRRLVTEMSRGAIEAWLQRVFSSWPPDDEADMDRAVAEHNAIQQELASMPMAHLLMIRATVNDVLALDDDTPEWPDFTETSEGLVADFGQAYHRSRDELRMEIQSHHSPDPFKWLFTQLPYLQDLEDGLVLLGEDGFMQLYRALRDLYRKEDQYTLPALVPIVNCLIEAAALQQLLHGESDELKTLDPLVLKEQKNGKRSN